MMYKSVIVGTALLAAAGDALGKTYSSVSKCDLKSISKASSQSTRVAAVAVAEANAALCHKGPVHEVRAVAVAAAEASATAFAEAMVSVSAACTASGNASFKVNGKSFAMAQATAIAEAFAIAQANAKSCATSCKAAADVLVQSFEQIYLEATVEFETELVGSTSGDSDTMVSRSIEGMAKAYREATVVAFAAAIADARAAKDECSAAAAAIAVAGDKDDPNVSACAIKASGSTAAVVVNALASASGEASAKTCGGLIATADFNAEAKAVAEAFALAVTEVSAGCFVKGKGTACAMGEADIKATATAVATAFVTGFAEANSYCFKGCSAESSVLATAIADVIAEAYSDIYFKHCISTNFFVHQDTKSELVIAAAPAIAELIGKASATVFGRCKAFLDATASIGPTVITKVPGGSLPVKPSGPKVVIPTNPIKPITKVVIPTKPIKKPTTSIKHRGGKARKGGKRGKHAIHRRGKGGRRVAKKGGRRAAKKGARRGHKKGGPKRVKFVKSVAAARSNGGIKRRFSRKN